MSSFHIADLVIRDFFPGYRLESNTIWNILAFARVNLFFTGPTTDKPKRIFLYLLVLLCQNLSFDKFSYMSTVFIAEYSDNEMK